MENFKDMQVIKALGAESASKLFFFSMASQPFENLVKGLEYGPVTERVSEITREIKDLVEFYENTWLVDKASDIDVMREVDEGMRFEVISNLTRELIGILSLDQLKTIGTFKDRAEIYQFLTMMENMR